MKSHIGLICAIIASMLWGMDYTIAEKLYKNLSIYTVSFYSCLIGLCVMYVLGNKTLGDDTLKLLEFNNLTWWFLLSITIGISASIMIAKSIQLSNATLAGLIEVSYPIFIVIFSYLFFKEMHMTKGIFIGSILIFVGIVVVTKYS